VEPAASRRPRPSERAAAAEQERQAAAERARQHQLAAARARARAAAREQAAAALAGQTAESGLAGWSSPAEEEAETGHPAERAELPPDRYLDREDSWLRFAERVLELADDPAVPLLERVRFSSIFAGGLDEFFGVRIAGRIRRMATGLPVENATGASTEAILDNALEVARELSARNARSFTGSLVPALAAEGIEILRWKELVPDEQVKLDKLFRQRIYPVLTPLAVDPTHPFPFISGLTLSLAVTIADPVTGVTTFARVKVPEFLPRLQQVSPNRFVPVEDVIAAHLGELFTGLDIIEHHVFRVTRATDLEIDEDVTEDLLKALEQELTRRRFGPPVRLEVEESISDDVLERLVTELDVDTRAVYRVPGLLDLAGLAPIADLDIRKLKYPRFVPSEAALPYDASVFSVLAEEDVLVHHPYDSFTASVQRLLVSAAADPAVLAIKQTLYRTSGDSEIVDALIDAAEAGKQVVVVVEIKARGDEDANIAWVHKLEEVGCHVIRGYRGLKTHCKMALIVREEPDGSLRRFCHIGTGNYHPKTARVYEDFGLLTADPEVGEDLTDLFNHLTGLSRRTEYRRLLVAPARVRTGLIQRIEAQAELARSGQPARIQLKCNALIDEAIIDALYRASMAGVPVDLWIRGICSIKPGVPGLSETIRVRSIVGRFLEHSRVYAFGTGAPESPGEVWIGSPDLMHRNLDRRVELLISVKDEGQVADLRDLIDLAMNPRIASWWLDADGSWTRHKLDDSGAPLADLQQLLISTRRGRVSDG